MCIANLTPPITAIKLIILGNIKSFIRIYSFYILWSKLYKENRSKYNKHCILSKEHPLCYNSFFVFWLLFFNASSRPVWRSVKSMVPFLALQVLLLKCRQTQILFVNFYYYIFGLFFPFSALHLHLFFKYLKFLC